MSVLLVIGAALAGDRLPMTCEAVFIGPVKNCSMDMALAATGVGPTQEKAERWALERLLEAAATAAEARALQVAGTVASARAEPDKLTCPAAVEQHAQITCFPSAELVESATCFADFTDDQCWDPAMVIREGTGWKVMEKARIELCKNVDSALESSALSSAERMRCRSRCLTESRVRCPELASGS